jgi:hypothetical protein
MLSAIILDPASPNPRASKAPILTIVYSRTTVSIGASVVFLTTLPDFLFFAYSSYNLSIAKASFSSS